MRLSGLVLRSIRAGALGLGCLAAGFAGATVGSPVSNAIAADCFAVASDVICIEAETVVPPALMPPILIPVGVGGDGRDENIVIEDDGGRHVARG